MRKVYIGREYFNKQCELLMSVCRHGHSELYFVERYAKLFELHHHREGVK